MCGRNDHAHIMIMMAKICCQYFKNCQPTRDCREATQDWIMKTGLQTCTSLASQVSLPDWVSVFCVATFCNQKKLKVQDVVFTMMSMSIYLYRTWQWLKQEGARESVPCLAIFCFSLCFLLFNQQFLSDTIDFPQTMSRRPPPRLTNSWHSHHTHQAALLLLP